MIFAKNVMLSNVLDIKEAFLDYENVHVIIIVHLTLIKVTKTACLCGLLISLARMLKIISYKQMIDIVSLS